MIDVLPIREDVSVRPVSVKAASGVTS